jgi:hypothetical protein
MSWWQRLLEWLRRLWGRKAAAATVGCIDLSTLVDPVAAPLILAGTNGGTATFKTSNNRVRTANGSTGLDCDRRLDIEWTAPASQLTFTLLTTAQPATIEAKDGAGAVVGTGAQAPPQHVVSTVTVSAPGSVQATVLSPADEVVLIEFCAT